VISVHDGEPFLAPALESLLTQEACDFEIVVVDDGSTDATPETLATFRARDARIVVETQPKRGLAEGLNRGIALARSPLVARLDADDIALPGRLARQVRFLEAHDQVGLVGGAVRFVDEQGRPFGDWEYPLSDAEIRTAFAHTTPFAHSAVMLRKHAFECAGGYRRAFTSALDLDLWLRIAEGFGLANLPEPLVAYRVHPQQMTVRHLERQALEAVAARAASRARAAGEPDPFEAGGSVDEATLLALGVGRDEIVTAFVESATWLAKTLSRAGNGGAADAVFAEAGRRARSGGGSPELVARVHRERARRYAEQRRWLRAKLEEARAVRAERTAPRA